MHFSVVAYQLSIGLWQGCILWPLLFNLQIDDLAIHLESFGIGVNCDGDNVCILMYADDIVLHAETERDLQILLNAINDQWHGCKLQQK